MSIEEYKLKKISRIIRKLSRNKSVTSCDDWISVPIGFNGYRSVKFKYVLSHLKELIQTDDDYIEYQKMLFEYYL